MNNLTPLETIIKEIHDSGQAWIEAKLKSDQLEDDEKNFLAALMNDLEKASTEKISEAKLERLARGSLDFRNYITGKVTAKAETGRKKVKYEAAQNYFEAKRSELSFEKETIAKGIFHSGGKSNG